MKCNDKIDIIAFSNEKETLFIDRNFNIIENIDDYKINILVQSKENIISKILELMDKEHSLKKDLLEVSRTLKNLDYHY